MIRFDAFTATLVGPKPAEMFVVLTDCLGPAAFNSKVGKGFHTFGERHSITDDSGAEVAAMQWGGGQGERTALAEVGGVGRVRGEHLGQGR